MSGLFSQTLREAPAYAEVQSHILLLRAGFIRQLASGIFSYLPLARRTLTKIEDLIRSEIDDIGGQEITMPVVHPADIWKETGRWYEIDAEMSRFTDRGDRDMVLAMTHEEVVADLVRREIKSYRQLPQLIYQIQTKWRDDPRPRSGLLRVREFTMKDSYSLDADAAGLELQYRAHYQAYYNIFHRCGLPMRTVQADAGMMGGNLGHEFIYPTPIGEDTVLFCESCGYSANGQIAAFGKQVAEPEQPADPERVATPDTPTIDALAELLEIPTRKTAKAVFVVGTFKDSEGGGEDVDRLILAVIRGDMEVSDTKLANACGAAALRPAREEEITASGAVAGYASPVGLKDVFVVADDSVCDSPNLVAGANEKGYHLKNVNYERDFEADIVVDIAAAEGGDACPECGDPLAATRGVETGHIFQLGTKYSDTMSCQFLDQNGKSKPVIMGSYGIGVGRLLACIAEEHHDDDGLIWPISVSPFAVHLVSLAKGEGAAAEASQRLYRELRDLDVDVLYDDRSENAGVKFKDADLIGVPVRITVGERSLKQGNLEVSLRSDPKEKMEIPVDGIVQYVRDTIQRLRQDLDGRAVEVDYKEYAER